MANHMPAPWSIDATQRGPVQIKSRHGFQVGTALTVDDARVMAAAPELLDALKGAAECLSRFGWGVECETARIAALSAIARAEGRTDGR